jgi:hypothetical protein
VKVRLRRDIDAGRCVAFDPANGLFFFVAARAAWSMVNAPGPTMSVPSMYGGRESEP